MNIAVLPSLSPPPTGYVADPERPILAVATTTAGGLRVAWHSHPRGQVVYAVEGVLRVVSRSGAWIVPPRQMVWVPPAMEHEVIAADSVTLHALFVESARAADLPAECRVMNVPPLLHQLILKAAELGHDYAAEGPARRLMEVIIDQLLELEPAALHLPMAQDKRLQRVINGLMQAPADGRGLEQWAEVAGASARTLARLFVRETGLTFSEWRKRLRLLEAIDRLGRGQRITRVALELGYDSASAFIAMFRRTLGAPPSRYFPRCERRG